MTTVTGMSRLGVKMLPNAIIAAICVFAAVCVPSYASSVHFVVLPGQKPSALESMHALSSVAPNMPMKLSIALPLQNQSDLDDTLQSLYDPKSPNFHHFLSTNEFVNDFCPSAADYAAVESYATSCGLTVSVTNKDRLLLGVSGPASAVERAFQVNELKYEDSHGKAFYGPDTDPSIPDSLSGVIQAIVGLDNTAAIVPQYIKLSPGTGKSSDPMAAVKPSTTMVPSNIRVAYGLGPSSLSGTGQTTALFELDGYTPSDVSTYESSYSLPSVTLTNVLVDGATGAPSYTGGEIEVTLDIELDIAMAPGVSDIMVYMAPNSWDGLLEEYAKIADDNAATQISSSWGLAETYGGSTLAAENTIFEQMAAQGQSIYAAAGDSGAYGDGYDLVVDDPASQPYMCGVGGTSLQLNTNQSYKSETTWGYGSEGGGGGISVEWPKPSWQTGFGLTTNMREVPDVSLDADPNTGYPVFVDGGWSEYGGTSCAAPLWASFTSLVNEQRSTNGLSPLGFPNPALYSLAQGPDYANDFHDIADNSTNLYYIAVPGFDDATGLGSYNGGNLLADLSTATPPTPSPQAAPTGLSATGLNSSQVGLSWTAAANATSYNVLKSTHIIGPYSCIGTTSNTTATASGLTNGQTYYFVVTANGPDGVSPNSNQALSGTVNIPGNLTATAISTSAITLSWTGCTGATLYTVQRGSAHGGPYTTVGTSTSANYTNSSLTAGTAYYYVVKATVGGQMGSASNEASATTPCVTPTGLTATTASSSSIGLKWTASTGAAGYNVLRGTAHGGPYTQIGTSTTATFTDSGTYGGGNGLAAATEYYYVVQATSGSAVSVNSTEANATTFPVAPTALSASTVSSSEVTLTWTGSQGATGYAILRGTATGGPYSSIGSTTSAVTYNNTSLTSGTTYYYVVRATDAGGQSANSNQAIGATDPAAPTGAAAKAFSSSQINLTWTASTGANGYIVSRGTASGGPYTSVGTPSGTSFNDTGTENSGNGLAPATPYYYVVAATSSAGNSVNGSQSTATTLTQAPTSLSASTVNATSISLSWTAATGATSYTVYRGTTTGGPYTQAGSASTATYTNTGLTAGTKYYYVVAGNDAGGASAYSNEANAATDPAAPTALTAKAYSATQINLTWTAPPAGATGYEVLRGTATGGPYAEIGTPSTTSYSDQGLDNSGTGLTPATPYYYVVEATSSAGNSVNSAQASASTLTLAPTSLAASTVNATSISLSWTAATGATSYTVYRGTATGGPYTQVGSASGATYTNTGLTAGTLYYYVVAGNDAGGTSPYSNEAHAATDPAAPTALTAKAYSATQINLTWTAPPAGATGYEVLRGTATGGPYTEIATPSTTSYSDQGLDNSGTGLTPATAYYYVVEATSSAGNSVNSSQASSTTLTLAPTILTIESVASTSIGLAWLPATGATSYTVFRSTSETGPFTSIGSAAASTSSVSYTSTGLTANTAYYYEVAGVDAGGTSAMSNLNGTTTLTTPPTAVAAKAFSSSQINLTWTAPTAGATGYNVLRGTASGGPYTLCGTSTTTSYQDQGLDNNGTGLSPDTAYYYVVESTTSHGASVNSAQASTTTLTVAPTGLAASTVNSTSIGLSWTAASGATGYTVYRGTTTGGPYTSVGSTSGVTYTNTGATPNTTYYYVVAAVDTGGTGAYSNEAHAATDPGPPTVVTAKTYSSTQINLTWTAPTNGASSYEILRGTATGGPYTECGTSTTTGYQDQGLDNDGTGLTPATEYYYVVESVTSAGNSVNSAQASSTTLTLAPTILTIESVAGTSIGLAWLPATGATSYTVFRSTSETGPFTSIGSAAASTSAVTYTSTGLTANTAYYYEVAGVDAGGTSAMSNLNGTTTLTTPPTAVAAKAFSSSQINLTWTAPTAGATGYNVLRGTASGGPYTLCGTSTTTGYQDQGLDNNGTGLSPDTAYYYVVESTTSHGASVNSAQASTTTLTVAPTGLAASTVNSTSISLSWTAASGASGYTVYRGTTTGGPYTSVGSTSGVTYTNTGATPNTTYYYVVAAVDTGGTGAYSNEASGATDPGPPTVVAATAYSSTQINLTWTAPANGASSYEILRGTATGGPYTECGTSTTTGYQDQGLDNDGTGLTPATEYYYVVESVNGAGNSVNSSQAGTMTQTATPTLLTIENVTSNSIELAWLPSTGATGYTVLRSSSETGPFTMCGSAAASSSTIVYTNTGLTTNTPYYYEVTANDAGGPSVPTGVNGAYTLLTTPTSLVAKAFSTTQINLTWTATPIGATGYQVWRSTSLSGTYVEAGTSTTASYNDKGLDNSGTGLTPGTNYYYAVLATSANNHSAATSVVGGATLTSPPTAVNLTAVNSSEVTVSWTGSTGASEYVVLRSSTLSGTYSQVGITGTTTYNNTGLSPLTTYYYEVYAVDYGGNSAATSPQSIKTPMVAPVGLQATTVSASEIDLTWTAYANATGYTIYSATTTGGPYTQIGTSTTPVFANTTGLSPSTPYFYVVTATTAAGTTPYSNEATATTASGG